MAVALLLVLLSLLPIIFDLIARSYEGLKLESEIQNSIMTRYFYYQLANVFVSVGLGSLANSLHQIIENPSSILSILGTSLPSLSIYFTNLLIVKTFTAVPLELLRVWPLLQILSVRMCLDRNKCTIRELKTGNTLLCCVVSYFDIYYHDTSFNFILSYHILDNFIIFLYYDILHHLILSYFDFFNQFII